MTAKIFLARPVSDADSDEVRWALALRAELLDGGYSVRLGGVPSAESDTQVAELNIAAVTEADVLVAVLPRIASHISSVWVEIGMALAASVPVMIVPASETTGELPFVVGALLDSKVARVVIIPGTSPAVVSRRIAHELGGVTPPAPRPSSRPRQVRGKDDV